MVKDEFVFSVYLLRANKHSLHLLRWCGYHVMHIIMQCGESCETLVGNMNQFCTTHAMEGREMTVGKNGGK